MTMTLPGIRVWNGQRDLGICDIEWQEDRLAAPVSAHRERDASLSIIPGLIDTHVHLIGNASTEPADFLGWPVVTRPEEQVLHGLSHAQTALRAGTTTLRDLAADHIQFSLKRALDAGVVEGPRLFAGGIVSMTGGHGDMFTPVGVEVRRATADGPWACRALVRTWARAGATSIKIATSGGVLSADQTTWRNHTDEEIAAIVDEAHGLGLTVAAHAHTAEGILRALAHGVDSLEHATQLDDAMFARIVREAVTVAPTLLINDRIASGAVPVSAQQSAKAAEVIAVRNTAMRAAAEAGVEFVLGTDANGFHVGFADQMAEVRRMSEVLGYRAERALQAATSRAARVLRAEDRIGTLEAGYAADFVIMRGRPWEEISDLHRDNVVAVVSRGRLVAGQLPV